MGLGSWLGFMSLWVYPVGDTLVISPESVRVSINKSTEPSVEVGSDWPSDSTCRKIPCEETLIDSKEQNM